MKIDEKCLGKWMWRKTLFGKQEFKPLYIISGSNIMGEKIIGIDGGRIIGFGFYHYIRMFSPSLNDWHFLEKRDYCNSSDEIKKKK